MNWLVLTRKVLGLGTFESRFEERNTAPVMMTPPAVAWRATFEAV
jgi:hypothetical protein